MPPPKKAGKAPRKRGDPASVRQAPEAAEEEQQISPKHPLALPVDSDDEEWKVPDSLKTGSRDEESCCNPACCNRHGDVRGIDEMFSDFFVKPIVNTVIGFFSQPINVSLTLYYASGVIALRYLEHWDLMESAYFLTVTATTVGYGDFHPVTAAGKVFTSIICLYGLTVVLAALAPVVEFLHGDWREVFLKAMGASSSVDTSNMKLSMKEVNARINYRRCYILACVSPTFVCLIGMSIHYFMIREPIPVDDLTMGIDIMGLVDGFYWAIISMTTIGYGDIKCAPAPSLSPLVLVFPQLDPTLMSDTLLPPICFLPQARDAYSAQHLYPLSAGRRGSACRCSR